MGNVAMGLPPPFLLDSACSISRPLHGRSGVALGCTFIDAVYMQFV
jgi:hypothetical protein